MTKAPEAEGNLTELKVDIKKAADHIIDLKAERAKINSAIGEVKAGMAVKGIPRRAFNRALQDYEATKNVEPDDTTNAAVVDEGYVIAREALLIPIQGNLFDDGAKPQ
tara:strand:- start:678 stop:1001 length:324 start_codon:yes stop_codon:yes gene_type:complete